MCLLMLVVTCNGGFAGFGTACYWAHTVCLPSDSYSSGRVLVSVRLLNKLDSCSTATLACIFADTDVAKHFALLP